MVFILVILSGCQAVEEQPMIETETNPNDIEETVDNETGDLVDEIETEKPEDPIETEPEEVEKEIAPVTFVSTTVDGDKTSFVLSRQGKVVTEEVYDYIRYIEGTTYVEASIYGETFEDNKKCLINLEDLSIVEIENDFDIAVFKSKFLFEDTLIAYTVEGTWDFGYLLNGEIVDSPTYDEATDFMDGLAVVRDMDSDFYKIIDYNFDEVFIGEDYRHIYNYGKGYFGYGEAHALTEGYDPVQLMNRFGKMIMDDYFFDVEVVDSETILVGDETSYKVINGIGQLNEDLTQLIGDQLGYRSAKVIGDYIYFFKDTYQSLNETLAYDLKGQYVESNFNDQSTGLIHLGDDYYVESHNIANYRFTQVTIPQVTINGDETYFRKLNTSFYDYYGHYGDDELTEEELFTETEINFYARRIGQVAEINLTGYWYWFGAAHGNFFTEIYQVDLTSGQVYTLGDLFKEGVEYRPLLTDLIKQQIMDREEESYYFDFDKITVDEYVQFRADEKGITLIFPIYSIGPYAMGEPEFYFSYEVLDSFIDTNSVFYKNITVK